MSTDQFERPICTLTSVKTRRKAVLSTFLATLLAVTAMSAPSRAEDVNCPPGLGATTIDGNVLVTGICELNGTVVIGNVFVYSGGSLTSRNARIDGNIQADDAGDILVEDSFVGGSIQLDRLVGDDASIVNSEVIGSVQLNDNRSALRVDTTTVGADVQAFANSGGVVFSGNTIDGNLQCKDNAPAPTGTNNTVGGNAEDQCETLASTGSSGDSGGSTGSGGASDQCNGSLGAISIDGDLLIAAACTLDGTTVDGNIVLYAGGSLTANAIRVIGNIQADSAFEIGVANSDIDGNVQFDKLVGAASITNTEVGGSIQLNDNRFSLSVTDNLVNSDVQAFANVGGVDIAGNTVDGNLQCKDNAPAPTGGNNTVAGNKEDQCASLQPANGTDGTGGSINVSSGSNNSASGGSSSESVSAADSGGGSISLWMLLGVGLLVAGRSVNRRSSETKLA